MDTPVLVLIAFAGILAIFIFIYLAIKYFIDYNCNKLHRDCMRCPMNWLCHDSLDPSWHYDRTQAASSLAREKRENGSG